MKKIFVSVMFAFLFASSIYSQEVYDMSKNGGNNNNGNKNSKEYRWGFGISGNVHFNPLSGGGTISVKMPTKIPLVLGIDLYGRRGAFYLGGIFDVWFLNTSISSRGKFYLGIGAMGGYTFTDIDYYHVGGRIPVGVSFGIDKESRAEFYIDLTPALVFRNAFSSDRERYFDWTPSLGVRFGL